ncbi:hypothetical protein PHYSODRAFT_326125 [Phytophthora sojae]|uniref:Retrotransposon gag domain-containing protein n=1 Tax=Phytophthora sojae (strain P6497) TaxID=1094619 RepID=G4YXR4_PHYSP|nr:hypothetical protein PHYSODRAFT_326125 [Phytophthora sojae]EGZ25057.1 hypothetical protein PHYSODRAFT_326125 [Phytophthora sojae]|eukprot:XP_009520345.1 hypothetical protein PHYSODRAFT_326125 [Phytophthora sojae]
MTKIDSVDQDRQSFPLSTRQSKTQPQARLLEIARRAIQPTDGYTRTPAICKFRGSTSPQWCACPDSNQGFHRESLQEYAQAEFGQGNEASTEIGSASTPLKHDRSADRQSLGRSSTDGTEEGPATGLEEKPQPPPQVPSGTPAGHDANRGLPDESPPAQAGTQPPSARSTKKKPARSKSSRKKMKAPDSDADGRADLTLTVAEDQLAVTYYKKELHAFLLQDDVMKLLRPKLLGDLAGPVSQPTPGSDKLDAVQTLLRLFKEVGIIAGVLDAESLSTPAPNPGGQTPTSSPYVPATEDVESDSVDDPPPRMTLGPSGVAMLRSRAERAEREVVVPTREPKGVATSVRHSPERLESFFQAAMERFLKEQQLLGVALKSRRPKIKMWRWREFDPDDLDLSWPIRAAVATTATASPGGTGTAPRIRVCAMSELKEFSGKDGDEDRARSWVSKLSRTTRTTWKDLLQSFQVQYCGRGVSVARQYYHARKRSDESPLEYLHRLSVAGLRTRLQVKDGPPDVRREHVEHFIETLDDRDLADQLALLRIPDADTLEESKTVYGSIKPRAKPQAAAGARADPATRMKREICAECTRLQPVTIMERLNIARPAEIGVHRIKIETVKIHGHPSDRCLFVCKAYGEIHDEGSCPMEEFYNLIRQWYNPTKHGGMLPESAEKMLN